jgi:hypothetical protein
VPRRLPLRLLAALIFGAAGVLLPAIWFGPVVAPSHDRAVLVLYVVLPGLAAAAAGALGAPLLHPSRCGSGNRAALRGTAIALAALVIFAPLFTLGLKWKEPGWTNPLGLTVMILWVSLLTMGWAVAVAGALAGWLVWRRSAATPPPAG